MRTRYFMLTAFILMVAIATLARESDANIGRWVQLDDGMTMGSIEVLEAWKHRLYAGASNGIFISTDHGNTWDATSFKNLATAITIDGNTAYAGTWNKGIYRSDDAGSTWKPLRDGFPFDDLDGKRYYGEVRRILVAFDEIISVGYHSGTYVSNDRGETWQDFANHWDWGDSIWSMTQFDGYLWSAMSSFWMARSSDNGRTWEMLPTFKRAARVTDWAVLYNRLYVAGQQGIGRWNEKTRGWEYLMDGLPTGNSQDPHDPPYTHNLAVLDGRLFAGLREHGVYVFDTPTKNWSSVGLDGLSVYALLSYKSLLYAGTRNGLYCAGISSVQPHAKT